MSFWNVLSIFLRFDQPLFIVQDSFPLGSCINSNYVWSQATKNKNGFPTALEWEDEEDKGIEVRGEEYQMLPQLFQDSNLEITIT